MRAPTNRKVFVIGYDAITPLGQEFSTTWDNAVQGHCGFRKVTRCQVKSRSDIVGEIPDWNPGELDFVDSKEAANWNAGFVHLTMAACRGALRAAGLEMDDQIAPRTGCFIGSSLNGHDAYRAAAIALAERGPNRVSPYLLPNLCGNLPAGKAGMMLGFTGPIFSPQGACASGNYAMGLGARMIRDGDIDFALVGGVDTPILPEIIHGFENMRVTVGVTAKDRAWDNPTAASRPFSADRRGFVLSEGAGVLVLAAEEAIQAHGLRAKAEILGVGWSSDAYHFAAPNRETIVRAMREAIDDAALQPADLQYVNTHGTSTVKGDSNEINCLKDVFGARLASLPISSNKSQLGHTLGAAAAIEGALTIEGMTRGILLPTMNHIPDAEFAGVDVIPNEPRRSSCELALSNAFGFGGTNCCIVLRGV